MNLQLPVVSVAKNTVLNNTCLFIDYSEDLIKHVVHDMDFS